MTTSVSLPPLSDTGWPALRRSPAELRARARRRTARRSLLGAAAVAVVAAVAVTAGVQAWQRGDSTSTAAGPRRVDHSRWTAYGVGLTPPSGWTVTEAPSAPDRRTACLAGPDDATACTLRLVVSRRPHADVGDRLDPPVDVLTGCEVPTRLSSLGVERTSVGGRPAAQWTGRCAQSSSPVVAWALDNRTVMLVIDDPADAAAVEAARTTFATVTIPQNWPHDGMQWATAPPTASASTSAR